MWGLLFSLGLMVLPAACRFPWSNVGCCCTHWKLGKLTVKNHLNNEWNGTHPVGLRSIPVDLTLPKIFTSRPKFEGWTALINSWLFQILPSRWKGMLRYAWAMSSFARSVPLPRDEMSLAVLSTVKYFIEHTSESMASFILKPRGNGPVWVSIFCGLKPLWNYAKAADMNVEVIALIHQANQSPCLNFILNIWCDWSGISQSWLNNSSFCTILYSMWQKLRRSLYNLFTVLHTVWNVTNSRKEPGDEASA